MAKSKSKPERRRGKRHRPLSLTPQAVDAIVLLVEAGASPPAATGTLYSPDSGRLWMERGEAAHVDLAENPDKAVIGDDGITHHPDSDQDLLLQFYRRVVRAGAVAYGTAESRLHEKNPLEWLTGPVGRLVAQIVGVTPYVKRAEVEVNVLTVGTVVDQAFQVLEGDGRPGTRSFRHGERTSRDRPQGLPVGPRWRLAPLVRG